ncbi:MAG: RNA polymerase sigma factor [Eubacterium sp.]
MTNDDYISAVKRNSQRLYMLALSFTKNHSDAEDIMQDAFLKLLKHNKPFNNEEHLDKWLTAVCVNESKNYIKSPFRKNTVLLDEAKDLYTFDTVNDYDIFKSVMSLPKKERTVIHLFYYEDLPVKEIAKMLKIKESAVKTRLSRGRKHLKEMLGDELIYE